MSIVMAPGAVPPPASVGCVFASQIRTFVSTVARLPFAVRVTSWYRDPAHNELVGGQSRSQHLVGLAVDVVPVDLQFGHDQVVNEARRLGLVAVDEGDHVHVQAFPAGFLG